MLRRACALAVSLAALLAAPSTALAAVALPPLSPPPSDAVRPQVPTGLTATAGDGKAVLDWDDNPDLLPGDRYQVYRANGSGSYPMIADGLADSSYTVSGLTNGTSYSFRVSAGGSELRPANARYGRWTEPVSTKPSGPPPPTPPRPQAPSGLTAVAGDREVLLDWSDSRDLISGDRYQVYQDGVRIADGPSASTFRVTGLTNGRSYSFQVGAGGSSTRPASERYSPLSTPTSATPQGVTPPPVGAAFPKSYFYERVPANPTVHSSSSTWVDRIVDDGKPEVLFLNDWQYPQYNASAGDPEYTVSVSNYVGPQGDRKVRLPSGAKPAPGNDSNLAVTNRGENEYWGLYGVESINHSARTIQARGGGTVPLDGDGAFRGESSLRVATKLGVVTPEELEAGRIDHALMATVYCSTGAVNGAGNTRQCSSVGKPSGPPNGSRLQLQISDGELAAFPPWKRAILRAMRDYGIYVAETGGGFLKADYAPGTALATKWQNWLNAHDSEPGIDAAGRELDFVSGVNWRSRLRVLSP